MYVDHADVFIFNPYSRSREDNFQSGYPCGTYVAAALFNPGIIPK